MIVSENEHFSRDTIKQIDDKLELASLGKPKNRLSGTVAASSDTNRMINILLYLSMHSNKVYVIEREMSKYAILN